MLLSLSFPASFYILYSGVFCICSSLLVVERWNEWSQSGDVDGSRIIQSSGHRSVISNAALSRIGNGYRTDLFGDVIGPHDVRTSIFSISSWTTRICSRSGVACEKSRPNNVYQSIIVQRADKSITTMKFVILALTLPLVASFSQVRYISLRFFRTILQFKRSKMRRMLVSHRRHKPTRTSLSKGHCWWLMPNQKRQPQPLYYSFTTLSQNSSLFILFSIYSRWHNRNRKRHHVVRLSSPRVQLLVRPSYLLLLPMLPQVNLHVFRYLVC